MEPACGSNRIALFRFCGLGHITVTHYAAAQILPPCKGGLEPGHQFRHSVVLMNVSAPAQLKSSSHHFGISVSSQKQNLAIRVNLSYLTSGFNATQLRKADVQKNQIRL